MFIMEYGKMLVFYTLEKVPLSLVGTLMDSAYKTFMLGGFCSIFIAVVLGFILILNLDLTASFRGKFFSNFDDVIDDCKERVAPKSSSLQTF